MKAVSQRVPGFDQIMKVFLGMGLDPSADLHTLTVAHPGSSELSKLFVVVDGRFPADKFEAAIKEFGDGVRIAKVGNAWLGQIKIRDADKRVQSVCFALANGKTLVMSYQENIVKDALMRVEENRFVAKRIEDLLKTTNDKQTLSFLLTRDAALRLTAENKNDIQFQPLLSTVLKDKTIGKALQRLRIAWGRPENGDITGVSGAVTLSQDFKFEFHLRTRNEMTAQVRQGHGDTLVDAANIIADLLARHIPELAFLPDVTRTLRFTQNGTRVDFTGNMSYVNLAKLIAWLSPAE